MTTWLFNPFTYIAGLKSLLIGWAMMLLTAFIAYHSNTSFDGALDSHIYHGAVPVWYHITDQLIAWGSLVITFFLAGRLFSASSIRFIDVAGTTALARIPMFFVAAIPLVFPELKGITAKADPSTIGIGLIIVALVMVVFFIWMIALLYNAFKVSCNLKGNKAIVLFIVSLIVAEIISKIILHYLYLYA